MCQDLADVVAAAAEDGKDGRRQTSLSAGTASDVRQFFMSDLGLDGAAPSQQQFQLCVRPDRQTAEIHIRVALINRFNALGTGEIVRVA